MTEKQRRLIEKKLNYLKERLILETDASVQFKLQEEITELEQQLAGATDSRRTLAKRPTANTIENSENVVSGSDIKAGGNIHIGNVINNVQPNLTAQQPRNESKLPDEPNKGGWKKWLTILVATTAFLASVAECTGYNLRDFFKVETAAQKEQTAAPVTPKPKDTLPTKNSPPPASKEESKVQETQVPKPQAVKTLKISGDTNLGRNNIQLKAGESLELYYTVTRPCKVRIIYQLADSSLILLHNDLELTEKDINQRKVLDVFEAAPPLGKEQLYFFAQTEDFPKLVTHTEDDYEYIDEGLPEALEKTRGLKKKRFFAEDRLDILTMPND